jgi:hypothetical protein
MSNWDFGHGREPADPRDRRYPPPAGDAGWAGDEAYPADAGWPGRAAYAPGDAGWPGGGYQADDGDPFNPQTAPYPLTYERGVSDGRPTWSTGPQQAEPPRAARPTWPGRTMPQRPGPRPAAPWQTGPQSAAPQRPTRAQAAPQRAAPQTEATRAASWGATPPWAATPPPAAQFAGDQYAGGRPGYPGWDRRYARGQPRYPDGQWPDDPRGPRREGPWWDPDSWPGWRRWLIPVAVAVLAAAIGAALVLLTGTHPGASAAVGQANRTTQARPAANRAP